MDIDSMLTWTEFAKARPDIAATGEKLLYQHGLGLGFLSTVRPDGGPRVHPICPVLFDGGLFAMIVPGPKLQDGKLMTEYGNRWGREGPPDEAYSRVSNPERFHPLHDVAEEAIARLERDFQVERYEGRGLEPRIEYDNLIRAPVRLVPSARGSAPIAFTFSNFPGVDILAGRWHRASFPSCGCDACDETAEFEGGRLESLVELVTAGRFREALVRDSEGDLRLQHEFFYPDLPRTRYQSRGMLIHPVNIPSLIGNAEPQEIDWQPWIRR